MGTNGTKKGPVSKKLVLFFAFCDEGKICYKHTLNEINRGLFKRGWWSSADLSRTIGRVIFPRFFFVDIKGDENLPGFILHTSEYQFQMIFVYVSTKQEDVNQQRLKGSVACIFVSQ